ncbi:MAG: Gfo/Idh/MocA family oxidoreductase [Chloroflexi bacterium]|nr:Gfo/Idh/MocA family oxidoreductase [Chloroflexota bacterium]
MAKLRVAFVGGGWVSCNRHMPAALKQPEMELVGVISTERRLPELDQAALTAKFGFRRYGTALSESWVRDEVDALVIGTPPDSHHALVLEGLGLGKHLLVEKPFAMNVAQADAMIAAAQAADLRLGLIHNLQFAGAPSKARQMLASGQIGDLRGVLGFQSSNHKRRLPTWYKPLPLGLFTDESPHLIYMLQALLPGAQQMSAYVGPPLAPDDNTPHLVSTHFLSEDNISGSLHMTFVGAVSEWLLLLFGSRGTAVVDFFRDVCFVLPDDNGHESLDVLRTSIAGVSGHLLGVAASGVKHVTNQLDYGNEEVLRRFTAAVVNGAPLAGISAEDGRAVVEVMATLNRAAPHVADA